MTNVDDIKQFAGDSMYPRAPRMPYYPYLRLDGNEGGFTLAIRNGDKTDKQSVGEFVDVIMLRVRRKLSDYNSGKSSTEHNHKDDKVTLFQTDSESGITRKIDQGAAAEIRERHPELSTEQVVYSLYNGDLVRLIIKGASLGSENKPKGSIPFYDYLESIRRIGTDEHVWLYHTIIKPVEEMNKKLRKKYFAMSFEKGDRLIEAEMDAVLEWMKKLYDLIRIQDEYQGNTGKATVDPSKFSARKVLGVEEEGKDMPPLDEVPVINLDEDEIKPEDIPF